MRLMRTLGKWMRIDPTYCIKRDRHDRFGTLQGYFHLRTDLGRFKERINRYEI